MAERIGKYERELITAVVDQEARVYQPAVAGAPTWSGVGLYVDNIPRPDRLHQEKRVKWIRRIEEKGLIRIERQCFLRSTAKGRAAIGIKEATHD